MRKEWMVSLLLFFFLFPAVMSFGQIGEEELEYKVKMGETKTYEWKKYMNDGKSESEMMTVDTEDGEVEVITKKGARWSLEVTAVNETGAYGKYTIEGATGRDVRSLSSDEIFRFVMPTTNNVTYWTEWVKEANTNDGVAYSITEDLLVMERLSEDDPTYKLAYTYNWKTGWLVRLHYRYEEPEGLSEYLLEEVTDEKTPFGLSFPLLVPVLVFIGAGLIYRSKKRN